MLRYSWLSGVLHGYEGHVGSSIVPVNNDATVNTEEQKTNKLVCSKEKQKHVAFVYPKENFVWRLNTDIKRRFLVAR